MKNEKISYYIYRYIIFLAIDKIKSKIQYANYSDN